MGSEMLSRTKGSSLLILPRIDSSFILILKPTRIMDSSLMKVGKVGIYWLGTTLISTEHIKEHTKSK